MALQVVNYDLIIKAQQGDDEALALAVEEHKALVVSIVNKYVARRDDKEDLISIGTIGLLKAIRQFDTSYDVCFSTYAVPLILGELKKFFRDDGAIKVSRQIKETYRRIMLAQEELSSKLQRDITINDLQEYTKESLEDIIMAIESHYYPSSLSVASDEEYLNPLDIIGVEEKTSILEDMDLQMALEKLDPKERLFIQLRFFDEMKQTDLAERFFVSQVQISRWEKKILEKLKDILSR